MAGPEVGKTSEGMFIKLAPKARQYAEKLAALEGLSIEQYFNKLIFNDLMRVRDRSLPITTRVVKGVLSGIPTEIKQIISTFGQKR